MKTQAAPAAPHLVGHQCVVSTCSTSIPAGRTMCPSCWNRVPAELRRAVWAAWRTEDESFGHPVDHTVFPAAYQAAIDAAAKAMSV